MLLILAHEKEPFARLLPLKVPNFRALCILPKSTLIPLTLTLAINLLQGITMTVISVSSPLDTVRGLNIEFVSYLNADSCIVYTFHQKQSTLV